MSTYISSFFIEPVVRQARRFSAAIDERPPAASQSHANISPLHQNAVEPNEDRQTPLNDTAIPAIVSSLRDIPQSNPSAPSSQARQPSSAQRSTLIPVAQSQESPDTATHVEEVPYTYRLAQAPSHRQSSVVERESHGIPYDIAGDPRALFSGSLPQSNITTGPIAFMMDQDQSRARAGSSGTSDDSAALAMSTSLPADDGMRMLRRRIHEIRETNASVEEQARRLHMIMTEGYAGRHLETLRPNSPLSIVSQERPCTPSSTRSLPDIDASAISSASSISAKPDNSYNICAADLGPSFRPPDVEAVAGDAEGGNSDDIEDEGPLYGCKHYRRNVKVQCYDCRRWYPCRHCHDESEKHSLDRRKTENMLCMLCRTPQPASGYCRACGECAAWYYCDICKLWDDDTSKKIYHCLDCGICRVGEGIGKDYIHCKKCNVCISIGHADSHRCIERATECDCPICGEYLFNSSADVASMPCGHYMHKGCYKDYLNVAYKCPFCKKSVINMELPWRKLTHDIESQPMPPQFENTRVNIQCNDCSAKSNVKYHWLGNKCNTCDSYNTNEMQLLMDGEGGQPVEVDQATSAGLEELRNQEIVRPIPESPPRRPPLLGSGSYFHSERETERRPSTAALALEQLRLSPYEMLQRVSRSLSPIGNYLNGPERSLPRMRAAWTPSNEDVLDDENGVDFWGSAGRFLSSGGETEDEDDDEDGDDSSDDDQSRANGADESDDEDDGQPLNELDQIPWHA